MDKTCVIGKLYRTKLVLCNRGKLAFKVQTARGTR